MRVLIVASYNKAYFAPFIVEQAEALRCAGCEVDFFGIVGKGIGGYVKTFPDLKIKIRSFSPDVIHAHYGMSGLLANMQRRVPVVTTFHGSDINVRSVLPFSKLAMLLSRHCIFVSQKMIEIANPQKHFSLIPCGINLTDLQLTDKQKARREMGLNASGKYILFAGAFDNEVKNVSLAKDVMAKIPDAELLELKGYSRNQVTLLMCACDALLMTSHSEGSPQVIKEAMACGCPIVSVDVGDVKGVCMGVSGCYICPNNLLELQTSLYHAMLCGRTSGRSRIEKIRYDNVSVAERILEVYERVAKNKN